MKKTSDVWQGTLFLMVNHGTLYPILLKREQEAAIASERGVVGQQPQGQVLPDHSTRQAGAEAGRSSLGGEVNAIVTRFSHLGTEPS